MIGRVNPNLETVLNYIGKNEDVLNIDWKW